MFLPTDLIARERQLEYEREADKIRLIHLVKEQVADRLQKHGAALLKNQDKAKTPKPSKN